MCGNQVAGEDLSRLSALTDLQELHLSDNPIGAIPDLSWAEKLEYLDISSCDIERPEKLKSLSKAPLNTLHCQDNPFCEERCLIAVLKALPGTIADLRIADDLIYLKLGE